MKKKLGDLECVKVLNDGNVLIVCGSEEQKRRATLLRQVCNVNIVDRSIVGRKGNKRGVINPVPVDEDLDEFVVMILSQWW